MSYKISTAIERGNIIGTIAMPLIEEKTGFGCFRLSGQTLRPLRELFHATAATKIATLATLLHDRAGPRFTILKQVQNIGVVGVKCIPPFSN